MLISPVAEGFGFRLGPALATVAPRIPVLLMAGERDNLSLNPVKDVQPTIVRQRQSKVEFFPTPLHGYKLLRYQPKVPDAIMAFFDTTIKKLRLEEWEPRYNLTPVMYADIELVPKKAAAVPAPPAPAAKNAPADNDAAGKKADDDAKKAAPKNEEPPKAPAKTDDNPKKAAKKESS